MTTKILATHRALELAQLSSGDVVVRSVTRQASSVALHHSEVAAIVEDSSLMAQVDLVADDVRVDETDSSTVSVRIDEENNAEEWWDALRDLDRGSRALEKAIDSGRVTRAQLATLKALPGWADGPEFARTALIVEE